MPKKLPVYIKSCQPISCGMTGIIKLNYKKKN